MSRRSKAAQGVPWTLLTYAANKAITVGATIVLSRLLVPSDFGLVTLATLAVTFANVLRDLGLGGALIVRQDIGRYEQGTALTMMLALGVVVGLALAASGPVLAWAFDEPRLDEVVAALSPAVLLGGFSWFYETLMQRELQFRPRFIALLGQSLCYAGIAIAMAAIGAGVWSLVVGQLAGFVALCFLLFALAPYRVRPRFEGRVARDLLRTGSGFMAQGGLAMVQQNVDYIAVGQLGAGPVGLYSMAYRISELPYVGVAEPVAKVTFPAFAQMIHKGSQITAPYLTSLRYVALTACPVATVLSAAAEPFTRAVLGEHWLGMVGALSVLALWGALRPLQGTMGWALNSAGEARLLAVISAVVLIPLVPLLFVAARLGGIELVAWVMLADVIVSVFVISYALEGRLGIPMKAQGSTLAPILVACVAAWLATKAVSASAVSSAAGLALVLASAAGIAAFALVAHVLAPALLREAWNDLSRMLRRGQRGVRNA